jgi:hypothetical protein
MRIISSSIVAAREPAQCCVWCAYVRTATKSCEYHLMIKPKPCKWELGAQYFMNTHVLVHVMPFLFQGFPEVLATDVVHERQLHLVPGVANGLITLHKFSKLLKRYFTVQI